MERDQGARSRAITRALLRQRGAQERLRRRRLLRDDAPVLPAADDIVLALQILALISLSLAIVNLFPFLPLDGGHIFWALAEKVRGRPIPFRVMEQASYVGFVLVIMLFVVGLTNDIDRLRGEGFGVK